MDTINEKASNHTHVQWKEEVDDCDVEINIEKVYNLLSSGVHFNIVVKLQQVLIVLGSFFLAFPAISNNRAEVITNGP